MDSLFVDDNGRKRNLLASAFPQAWNFQSFLVKFAPDGKVGWAADIGTAGSFINAADTYLFPMKLDVDTAANIFIASSFRDSADFDPGPAIYRLKVGSAIYYYYDMDMSPACLYPDGSLAWAKDFGPDSGSRTYATGVGVDGMGNIYVTGRFNDTVDFDPGTNTYFLTPLKAWGYTGTFAAKLARCNNPKSYSSTQTCDSFMYNGYMRIRSGTYYQHFSNGSCDSIAVLELTIDTATQV